MRMVPWRNLRFGAMLAALVWQVLQVTGGYAVTHSLQRVSTLYGAFGVVLGLLGWLYLQATVTVYCAEVDAVLAKGRWPRSLLSAAGAPPEGAVRPRYAAPAGTVPAGASDRSRQETVPMSTIPRDTVPTSTAPAAPLKADIPRQERADAAIEDVGRPGARRDDSRENGEASREAGKE
jgi:hypothetical protein